MLLQAQKVKNMENLPMFEMDGPLLGVYGRSCFFCPIEHSMAMLETDFERLFEAFVFQGALTPSRCALDNMALVCKINQHTLLFSSFYNFAS